MVQYEPGATTPIPFKIRPPSWFSKFDENVVFLLGSIRRVAVYSVPGGTGGDAAGG